MYFNIHWADGFTVTRANIFILQISVLYYLTSPMFKLKISFLLSLRGSPRHQFMNIKVFSSLWNYSEVSRTVPGQCCCSNYELCIPAPTYFFITCIYMYAVLNNFLTKFILIKVLHSQKSLAYLSNSLCLKIIC